MRRRKTRRERSREEWQAIWAKGKTLNPTHRGSASLGLSGTVNLVSAAKADQSASRLRSMFASARNPEEQRRVLWETQKAASAARMAAASKRESPQRRRELRRIAEIYRREVQKMQRAYNRR